MTANNTTVDDRKNVASHANNSEDMDTDTNTDTGHRYHCPHCDKHYANEIFTRVHITRSDDATHANHDGFMPEAEITVTDQDGTEIRTVTKRPRDINAQHVTLDEFPNDLTDRHKLILLAATHNPHETEYTELKNRADELFEQHGHEPLSYATVRRVTRRFYRPDTSDRVNTADANTTQPTSSDDDTDTMTANTRIERVNQHGTLTDLTPKQQAIVIATITHPGDSNVRIADRINTAQSYPSQVTEKFNIIVERIQQRIDSGDAIENVLADELSKDNVTTLTVKNLLDDVAINANDILSVTGDTTDHEERPGREGTLDSFTTGDTDDDGDDQDNAPFDCAVSEQDAVMSASPYDTETNTSTDADTVTESADEPKEVNTETYTADQVTTQHSEETCDYDTSNTGTGTETHEHGAREDTGSNDRATTSDVNRGEGMIPRSQIEQLKMHVEFERRLAERTANQPGNSTRNPDRVAFAQIMESELNAILEQ